MVAALVDLKEQLPVVKRAEMKVAWRERRKGTQWADNLDEM